MAFKNASTYSFAQVTAILQYGPDEQNDIIKLTEGGVGEGGISIESSMDINNMKVGADGSVQHSLRLATPALLKVEVLRNNTLNLALATQFSITTSGQSTHGLMKLSIVDSVSKEETHCAGIAFKKLPSNFYKMDAEPIVWEFDVGNVTYVAGSQTDEEINKGGGGKTPPAKA